MRAGGGASPRAARHERVLHGSEGFDHPPSDVCTSTAVAISAMTGLGRECLGPGREPLSPWGLCLCVCTCISTSWVSHSLRAARERLHPRSAKF